MNLGPNIQIRVPHDECLYIILFVKGVFLFFKRFCRQIESGAGDALTPYHCGYCGNKGGPAEDLCFDRGFKISNCVGMCGLQLFIPTSTVILNTVRYGRLLLRYSMIV